MISHIEILEKLRCRETIPLLSDAKEIVFQRAESLIDDLSPLVNASSINISSCASITNLHVLQKIPTLSLSVTSLPQPNFLNDLQTLQNKKLILNGIHLKVNTLSFLQNCTEVTLSHTRNFLSLLNNSLELQYFKHLYSLMIEDILIEHIK
eukprot:gene2323-2469_t